MIRKLKSGEYRLYSRKKDAKTGKRKNLGTFGTRAEAGEWNEATRTMEWKNAPTDPLLYTTRCTFETATTMRCSGQVKNLGGKVAIDSESVALRRTP